MSSPAAAPAGDLVLPVPALPPIKTAAAAPAARTSSAPSTAPAMSDDGKALKEEVEEGEGAEPTTPTSEESRLRAPTECPPAPRKPARTTPLKRKSPSSSSSPLVFFPVQRDLSAVFRSLPPKKRIRAG
ncbi:transcriptional regulatory protein AlgP-like [Oryza brachyantha]|uniref:transcriptional regulatory protein AlgP-like n=1 Tax=Oryza brachyantha TaxID=4533 RepID=UPI001ADABFFA|nr:transcriptional regulatory protein AlgP-like [Oryza brachyantha]XP_040382486.1 transcriptional regulatory protein AlgP-like [Oryza brachyantha]